MQLRLESIGKKGGGENWLYDISLSPQAGAVTVLLGATQAGNTSLMRIMTGLDTPNVGEVVVDGNDVHGQSVRQRNIGMVSQQFINYPSLTAAQHIASPLRLSGEQPI